MRRSLLLSLSLLCGGLMCGPLAEPVQACPMCKEANESDSNLPRAYMYSILFMLAMPATVLTGFGLSFYRLSKKQQALNAATGYDLDVLLPAAQPGSPASGEELPEDTHPSE